MNTLPLMLLSICILSSCTLTDIRSPQSVDTLSPQISSEISVNPAQDILIHAYQEELLAHDIYTYMVDRYPELSEVKNIINSENEHREKVGNLLDVRSIVRPTTYGIYADTYTTLKNMIDTSLTGAIEAGIMVETGDIDHLLAEYQKVSDTDVRQVFENIGGGSYNHLRAFLRMAQSAGYTPKTDATPYLTPAEISQSGSLKYKMTELLQANHLPASGSNAPQGGGH